MTPLERAKADFPIIATDEVEYFGKIVKVKLFESLNDPAIVNKSGGVVPLYAIASVDDFIGIANGQNIIFNGINYTVYNFRVSIYGTVAINLVGADE